MPKFRIKIKDAKSLKDSIEIWKKKIRDADFDLTRTGVVSIANSLMEKKEEIASTTKFADLRDIVKEQVGKFDTPKSREILAKVDELDRMYQRDPRPGSRNDYWVWDKLLRYVYNILLKASGSPSPDVKETKPEDSACVKDSYIDLDFDGDENDAKELADRYGCQYSRNGSANNYPVFRFTGPKDKLQELCKTYGMSEEDFVEFVKDSVEVEDNGRDDEELKQLIRLLGQAHNLVIEADELAGDLAGEGKIPDDLVYAIEDLEAESSDLDFEGEADPLAALKEKFDIEENESFDLDEDYDIDED